MILLTGATGRVGSATGKALARSNVPFRALVRDPDKVTFDPDAAEIVVGDLNDPAIVKQALEGVSRALVVMGNHPDQAKLERQFASLPLMPVYRIWSKCHPWRPRLMPLRLCPKTTTTQSSTLLR